MSVAGDAHQSDDDDDAYPWGIEDDYGWRWSQSDDDDDADDSDDDDAYPWNIR